MHTVTHNQTYQQSYVQQYIVTHINYRKIKNIKKNKNVWKYENMQMWEYMNMHAEKDECEKCKRVCKEYICKEYVYFKDSGNYIEIHVEKKLFEIIKKYIKKQKV